MKTGPLVLAACVACARAPQQSRFQFGVGTAGVALSDGGGSADLEMQSGQVRTLELFVIGETSAPVTFSGENLPPFATLQGALLTLSPVRADAGDYTLILSATSGAVTESQPLHLAVHRANTAPRWDPARPFAVMMSDDLTTTPGTSRFPVCPGPFCTLDGAGVVNLDAIDDEGDRVVVQVEVVTRGQAFSKVATYSATAVPDSYNDARVAVPLTGLSLQQSYDFAVRVSDEFGAVAIPPVPTSDLLGDGWVHMPAYQFDQGPCSTKACACEGFDSPCQFAIDCCSGVCAPDYVRMFSYCK